VRYAILDPDRNFETEGQHEAIISEELYQQAQALIVKNSRAAPTKKPDEHNYFVNMLYCAECGEKYLPHNTVYDTKKGKSTLYNFMCRTRHLKGNCSQKSITAKKVEAALTAYLSTFDNMFDTDSEAAARLEQERRNNEAQIQNYREQLRHYESREKEVMSHYIAGHIDFDSYRGMKKQLDSDREFVRAALDKLTVHESEPATICREEVAASFRESWQGLTNTEKRLFLTNYIKKIVVSNEPVEGSRFGDTKVTHIEFNTN